MKWFIRVLFLLILAAIATGYYLKNIGDHVLGDRIIGLAILATAFLLMPIFIYYRSKGKNLKDYMFTQENLNKMHKRGPKEPDNQ